MSSLTTAEARANIPPLWVCLGSGGSNGGSASPFMNVPTSAQSAPRNKPFCSMEGGEKMTYQDLWRTHPGKVCICRPFLRDVKTKRVLSWHCLETVDTIQAARATLMRLEADGVKVQMRLRVMFLAMCQYFSWDAEKVQKPFAEEIPLYPESPSHEGVGEAAAAGADAAENSNLPGDVSTDDVPIEDTPGSGAPEGETASSDSDMDHEGGSGVGDGSVAFGGGETDGGDD